MKAFSSSPLTLSSISSLSNTSSSTFRDRSKNENGSGLFDNHPSSIIGGNVSRGFGSLVLIQNHDEPIEIVFELDDDNSGNSKNNDCIWNYFWNYQERIKAKSMKTMSRAKVRLHSIASYLLFFHKHDDHDDEEDDGENREIKRDKKSVSADYREKIQPLEAQEEKKNGYTRWQILCFGQVLSFLLASTGASQSMLEFQCNLSAPTFMVGLVFFCLSFLLLPLSWKRTRRKEARRKTQHLDNHHETDKDDSITCSRKENDPHEIDTTKYKYRFCFGFLPLEGSPVAYFFMALVEVEAMYFTVLALRYTTITSVALFDALAIPSAMILSQLFLKRKYSWIHIMGVTACMVGIFLTVMQDCNDNDSDTAANAATADDTTTAASTTVAAEAASNAADEGQYYYHDHDYYRQHYYHHHQHNHHRHQYYHYHHQQQQQQQYYPQQQDNSDTAYPHRLYGDILAIIGGILYGANDVLCEYAVRKMGGPQEFLGMLGFFAAFIAVIQAFLFETNEIMQIFSPEEDQFYNNDNQINYYNSHNNGTTITNHDSYEMNDANNDMLILSSSSSCSIVARWWLIIMFVIVSVSYYIGTAYFLTISESAFMNLSCLTGDFWTVLFSIVAEKIIPSNYFFVALTLIITGVGIYEVAPTPIVNDAHGNNHDDNSSEGGTDNDSDDPGRDDDDSNTHYDFLEDDLKLEAIS